MKYRATRLAFLATTALIAAGAAQAGQPCAAEVDPCVVYPYYGRTTTAVPAEVDVCVVYPYYGQTTTPVPGASPARTTAHAADGRRDLVAASHEEGDAGL